MKTNLQNRRGFTLVELLVVIVIIASLAGLTAPMVIRQRKKADQTEAISNARQIGLAMFEFETEYTRFPDDSSGAEVAGNTGSSLAMGAGAANNYFRQLIGAGYTQSEQMFYAKVPGSRKPDGNINGVAALDAREVGFGYITLGPNGLSTAGNPARPYVVTPLLGASGTQFDKAPFDGKAVVLRIDNSVSALTINNTSNEAILTPASSGSPAKTLIQTGADTVWGVVSGSLGIKFPTLQ